MIYIQKNDEPSWMIDFKKKHPKANYDSKEFEDYRIRLREELIKEQKKICAYCCCKIDMDTSHNEHIEPRNPKNNASYKSLDYNNIIASCYGFHGDKTCGIHKGNSYDENLFVSPLNPNCEENFSYYPNGTIVGDDYTIDLLNLNSYRLKKARESVYSSLISLELEPEMISAIYCDNSENYEPFINVIRFYIRKNMG